MHKAYSKPDKFVFCSGYNRDNVYDIEINWRNLTVGAVRQFRRQRRKPADLAAQKNASPCDWRFDG
jgi:hypothetical protein